MNSPSRWLHEGCFGLMVHWLAPGPPPRAGKKVADPEEAVALFDLDHFLDDVAESKAAWVIFTIGQNTGYYVGPNSVLDRFAGPGHGASRDLIAEMAERVKAMGLRFVAYLPADIHAQTQDMQSAFGWTDAPAVEQDEFRTRYAAFVREYALRLGSNLDGWWFDGGMRIWASRPERLLDAARAGNSEALATLNNGSLCVGKTQPAVDGQDYLAGEVEVLVDGKVRLGRDVDAPLLDPTTHPSLPPAGCLWHALVPIDCMWAHGCGFDDWMNAPYTIPKWTPGVMEPPLYATDDLALLVRQFKAAGGGVTFNVGIFQEGILGEKTVAQLAELAEQLCTNRKSQADGSDRRPDSRSPVRGG